MLLVAVVSGAWAQSTTHVVNQDNVNDIFSGDGYTLGSSVKNGDILDFQGTIDLEGDASHSLIINKAVTIMSSTQDAVVRLHTKSGSLMGEDPGTCFVINKDASGTTVQDIRLENTQMWIYNTSNVTFTGVTFHVDNAKVGNGTGHVAIRYSDHITFDGCTVYTENNGGSSACVLTLSNNCTFKDSRFECVGNTGNPLFLGNPYNTQDKPDGFTETASNDCTVTGCTITGANGALSKLQVMGLRHRIENCTVDVSPGLSGNATTAADGYIIRNNTFTQGLSVPAYSTAEGNTVTVVTGNLMVNKGSTITNNSIIGNVTINFNSSDYTGSTITGNNILGKVTFGSNSKNNTFTGNTVISSEAYAVVMATTADANNTVTDNILLAASNAGDAAVNLNNGTGNTISNNLSEATAGDVTWNFDAATGTLTISGTGAMADFELTTDGKTTAPWAFLSDKITRIIIEEGVTKIGNNAFAGCTAVNDVFAKGDNAPPLGTNVFDATATPAIYVPSGKEAAYKQAWSDYADNISGYMSCGDNASAVYDATTHTLTICGKGAMTDLSSATDQPWKSLQGDVQNVIIEPTITAIGTNAFSGCTALSTVNILGTATTIADGAFDSNATGRRIFVPVSAIAGYGESTYAADIYATGLCGATGSESDIIWELNAKTLALNILGTGAMADYASSSNVPWYSVRTLIKSATIGSGITTVGKNAFPSCTGMATVSLPEGLTTIGEYAFNYCSALETVSIPATVTTIGNTAFRNCLKLESVSIPSNVTTIGSAAFQNCSALTAIVIPEGVTLIDEFTFANCSELKDVTIPYGVTTINSSAFEYCI